jgi:hypothetical protein
MNFKKSCLLALTGVALAASAHADGLYSENFDNLATSGWILTNNSAPAGQSWFQGVPEIFAAQSGAAGAYAGANFLSTAGNGSISNWLISPEITLGSASVLTFYVRTEAVGGYADALNVYFNAGSASATSSFTSVLSAVNAAQGWTQYSVNLPDAATGRIAFEYAVSNADNANYIGLDTVQITAVPEPTTYGLMALGLLGIAALRRRSAD